MAILKYVPPTKKIIDNRKPEGGYYEAKCEICGTIFYPQRSNTKYCTPNCGLIAHRVAVANGTAKPKKAIKTKKTIIGQTITGKQSVLGYLSKKKVKIWGLLSKISNLDISDTIVWSNYSITKVSMSKYQIVHN